jgi:hypothetical protein
MSCATPSGRGWRRPARRCAQSKRGWDTPDASTTEIYAHYAPDPAGEVAFAERAFGGGPCDLEPRPMLSVGRRGLERDARSRPTWTTLTPLVAADLGSDGRRTVGLATNVALLGGQASISLR